MYALMYMYVCVYVGTSVCMCMYGSCSHFCSSCGVSGSRRLGVIGDQWAAMAAPHMVKLQVDPQAEFALRISFDLMVFKKIKTKEPQPRTITLYARDLLKARQENRARMIVSMAHYWPKLLAAAMKELNEMIIERKLAAQVVMNAHAVVAMMQNQIAQNGSWWQIRRADRMLFQTRIKCDLDRLATAKNAQRTKKEYLKRYAKAQKYMAKIIERLPLRVQAGESLRVQAGGAIASSVLPGFEVADTQVAEVVSD